MRRVLPLGVTLALVAGLSCAHSNSGTAPKASPSPAAGNGVTAQAAPPARPEPGRGGEPGGPPNGPPNGPPGGRFGGRGRVPLTPEQRAARRDSIAVMRKDVIAQLDAQLAQRTADYENKRAGDVFKNLQLFQDSTVGALLRTMDDMGNALSYSCASCHVPGQWDDDTKGNKRTARMMIEMVETINSTEMPKLGRGPRTPKINCVTCHRGSNDVGRQLLP